MVNIPLPDYVDESKQVEILRTSGQICSLIFDIKGECKPFAFDYETTGLKPHDKGKHRIICMSLCNSPKKAYAFMIDDVGPHMHVLKRLLKSHENPKIAHNMQFEHRWTKTMLGFTSEPWGWDTQLAAHILDNRPGITSLKFQVYVNFGVVNYEGDVEPYLKRKDVKNANAVNRIEELIKTDHGQRTLMTYCGMDSLFTYKLAMKQMELIN
jgi:hypothetical protein